MVIESFKYDEEGRFIQGEDNFVDQWTYEVDEHKVNFVFCRNVYTEEEHFFGENDTDTMNNLNSPLERFLQFTYSYNMGNNTFAAHNAKGYDSRLILHHVTEHQDSAYISLIKTGTKLIQLKIGRTNSELKVTFIDSLSHLPGSLKKLAKDMCGDLLAKGYFPHRFNTPSNYSYIGPLPSKGEFDIYFSARNQRDVDEFNSWWEQRNQEGPWNFMEEMKFYNRNDVLVLADIMKKYDKIMFDETGMSPWFNATGPSYCHEVTLVQNVKKLKDQYDLDNLKTAYPVSYTEKIQEIVRNEYWAVKKPVEYAPTKLAFRGGRTEVTALYAKLSEDEIAQGVRIRAADICSSYPSQQIKQRFPVGLPRIRVWDPRFYPCTHLDCISSLDRSYCDHERFRRHPRDHPYTEEQIQPTARDILDQDWNGYVCVTIQPCKMLHPVIPIYCPIKNKCLFTCEKLVECWVDSPTLKTALKVGSSNSP